MVGRALQGEIDGDLEAVLRGGGDEGLEIGNGSQVGMHGLVPALGRADRPWAARVVWPGVERVVRAFAVHATDGVDGRQVQHVEPHGRHGGQALGRGRERAALPRPVALLLGPFGTREELVPAADHGARALDPQHELVARRAQTGRPVVGERGYEPRVGRDREPGIGREGHLADGRPGVAEHDGCWRASGVGDRALEQLGSRDEHEFDIDSGADLERRRVHPGRPVVGVGLDSPPPVARLLDLHVDVPAIGARGSDRHRMPGHRAVGRRQYEVGTDEIMPFAEDGGRERHHFADEGLARPAVLRLDGAQVTDRDAPDAVGEGGAMRRCHPSTLRRERIERATTLTG